MIGQDGDGRLVGRHIVPRPGYPRSAQNEGGFMPIQPVPNVGRQEESRGIRGVRPIDGEQRVHFLLFLANVESESLHMDIAAATFFEVSDTRPTRKQAVCAAALRLTRG